MERARSRASNLSGTLWRTRLSSPPNRNTVCSTSSRSSPRSSRKILKLGIFVCACVRPAPFILGQLIPKGYITLDGTSLTLTHINPPSREFSIMLIAHTQSKVIMTRKSIGDSVNVECDAVGKWVLKGVEGALSGIGGEGSAVGKLVQEAVERAVEKALKDKGLV